MVTHTEALMNLDVMGYPELSRAGYAGHQAHIAAPVPEIDPATEASTDRVSLEAVMSIRPESVTALRLLAEVIANFASDRNR